MFCQSLHSIFATTDTNRIIFFLLFVSTVHIRNVCSWYKTSFAQLRSCPVPQTVENEEIFAKVIESIYERHSNTLITMAKGAHELRHMLNQDTVSFADSEDIQKRLDEFYMSRIGIRMVSVVTSFWRIIIYNRNEFVYVMYAYATYYPHTVATKYT